MTEATFIILTALSSFLLFISFALIGVMTRYVFLEYRLSRSTGKTTQIFSTFNVLLMGTFLSGVVLGIRYIAQIVTTGLDTELISQSDNDSNPTRVVADLAASTMQVCYMWYNWIRGSGVIEIVAPRLIPVIKVIVHVMPISLYTGVLIPPIALALPESPGTMWCVQHAASYFASFNGCVSIAFDLFVFYSYSKYLYKLRKLTSVKDRKLTIICKHSFASTITFLMVGVVSGVGASQNDIVVKVGMHILAYALFLGVSTQMLMLKIDLFKDRLANAEDAVSKKSQASRLSKKLSIVKETFTLTDPSAQFNLSEMTAQANTMDALKRLSQKPSGNIQIAN